MPLPFPNSDSPQMGDSCPPPCSRSLTPRTDAEISTYFPHDDSISLIHLKDHARNLELELNNAMSRIGHAEILLSDLASGYWRAAMNEQDPSGEGIMGERVMQYWAQYSENAELRDRYESATPPIRTVEEYRASYVEWEAAQICSDQHPDADERKRATEAQIIEERRWEEARPYFEFDDEGDIIGLVNS